MIAPSQQGSSVPTSRSPVLQDAATPERDAKKRRLDRDEPDRLVDDVELSPGVAGRPSLLARTPPSRRLARKTSLGSDGVPCGDAAQASVTSVGVRDSEMGSGSASVVRGRGRGRGGYSDSVVETATTHTVGARGAVRGGRRGAATGPSTSAAEVRRPRASDAAVVTDTVPVRRSARVAARSEGATTRVSERGRGAGGGMIVSGLGDERVEDVTGGSERSMTPALEPRALARGPGHAQRSATGLVAGDAALRQSVRVATREQGVEAGRGSRGRGNGGGRIVSGFGTERVDDVAADERQRSAAGAQRGDWRREMGERGRMTDLSGVDLDRSAGGAWHAGRRSI